MISHIPFIYFVFVICILIGFGGTEAVRDKNENIGKHSKKNSFGNGLQKTDRKYENLETTKFH